MKKILYFLLFLILSNSVIAFAKTKTSLTLKDVDSTMQPFLDGKERKEPLVMPDWQAIQSRLQKHVELSSKQYKNPNVQVLNENIPNPDNSSLLRVRLYIPDQVLTSEKKLPLLLYLHGGGMTLGLPEQDEELLIRYAAEIPAIVASPDYRLAPKYPYPSGLDDCYTTLLWLFKQGAEKYKANPKIIMLGGASAGGNLALALALRSRDLNGPKISFVSSIYPMLDSSMSTPSMQFTVDSRLRLTPEFIAYCWQAYTPLNNKIQNKTWFDPFIEINWHNFPSVYISCGTADPLFDSNKLLVEKLQKAKIPVTFKIWPGAIHAFEGMPVPMAEQAKNEYIEKYKEIVEKIK